MLFEHKYHIKNIWKNHPFIYGLNFLYFNISCIMVKTSVIAEVHSEFQKADLLSFRVAGQGKQNDPGMGISGDKAFYSDGGGEKLLVSVIYYGK